MEEKTISVSGITITFVLLKGEIQGFRKSTETKIKSKGGGSTIVPTIDGKWVAKNKDLKIESTTTTTIELTIVNEDGSENAKTFVDQDFNFRDGQKVITVVEKETSRELACVNIPLNLLFSKMSLDKVFDNAHPAYKKWAIAHPHLVSKELKRDKIANIALGGTISLLLLSLFVNFLYGMVLFALIGVVSAIIYKIFFTQSTHGIFLGAVHEEFKKTSWFSVEVTKQIASKFPLVR